MKKIAIIAQELLLEVMPKSKAIDFTCGNGNDTYFLAQHYAEVYAFDIQEMAIQHTKERCIELDNASLFQQSHQQFDKFVPMFNAGIFNLGYLPQGDKKITTDASVVIETLQKCWQCLTPGGRVVLVLYPGFQEGKLEAEQLERYCAALPSKQFDVLRFQLVNRIDAPYILCIDYHAIGIAMLEK